MTNIKQIEKKINIALLRSKIYEKFASKQEFAKAIGWSVNKVTRILSDKHTLDINEAAEISKILNLTLMEHTRIFMPWISPIGDKCVKEA